MAQEYRRLLKEKHEKHHALASEHERCSKLMQKAMENLSRGLHLSTRESANLGLTVEGVAPGASLLPRQTVSSPPVEKASRTPSAFQIDGEIHCSGILTGSTSRASTVQANVLDEPPVQFYAAQPN